MPAPPEMPDDAMADLAPDLLLTKLHLPGPPADVVPRPRLDRQLDRGFAGEVTLVCAPPGFGKSVLVAGWCRRRQQPTAWLSLDPDDNDPARFWRHVAAALDRALHDPATPIGEAVAPRLRDAATDAFRGAAEVVVNAVTAAGQDVVLVIDDYHVVDEPRVHGSVRHLLQHAPPHLHVGLLSRADPPLGLARTRARGALAEVRAADLRFTPQEAADLLAGTGGPDLMADAVAALTTRTEGWAAGLQLAMLSLRGQRDVGAFVDSFSGSSRFVLDYLSEEVLRQQPEAMRDFLVETSLLDRLSGPVCDAVTGRTDSQQLLEAAERANLFLVPLDDTRGWWRYHHLFGDLLASRLAQLPPDRVGELHRRAARWYDAQGRPDQAIRHALKAGDPAWAARVIERHADGLLMRAEGVTLLRWFARLPADLQGSQRLLLAQARAAVYGGRVADAEQLLDAADRIASHDPSGPFEPTVEQAASPMADLGSMSALLRAFVAHMRGDPDTAESLASPAVAATDDPSAPGLIARWHLATGPWLRGDVAAAEPAVAANIAAWRQAGQHDRAAWSAHYLGQVQQARGDLDAATATYQEVLAVDVAHTGPDAPAAGVAHIGLAQVAYQRDDLEASRRHAVEGIARCRQFVDAQALAVGLSTLALVELAEGDPAAADAAITDAMGAGPGPEVVDLLNPVPAVRARLLLARGDVDAALRWADGRGLGVDDPPCHANEPAHLVLARIMLAQDLPDRALRILAPRRDAAGADRREGGRIEIDALRALALRAAGDRDGALTAIAGAVTMAARQGHIRAIADEGAAMGQLLGELVATSPPATTDLPLGHLARLVTVVGGEERGGGGGLVVPLTDREMQVLVMIATGRRNKDIAAELFVSPNTVKTHIAHIFEKLGVGNRTAAIDRARQLGLLT